MASKREIICLFDVDGTLTKPRNNISLEMEEFLLNEVKPHVTIGLVGGSDLAKISGQLGGNVTEKYHYVFPENGLVAYKNGELLATVNLQDEIGEEPLQDLLNECLLYMSKIRLPMKRGTFVEFRSGLINVSPIGRNCSQQERDDFEKYDQTHHVREKFVQHLKNKFPAFTYSIGGQISFDVFPTGWDKTYCLRFLDKFDEIHFFGDKTYEGGNDYEIFNEKSTIGHSVASPVDTKQILEKLLDAWGFASP